MVMLVSVLDELAQVLVADKVIGHIDEVVQFLVSCASQDQAASLFLEILTLDVANVLHEALSPRGETGLEEFELLHQL